MTNENKRDEQPPPHYEGGIPILPGEAERAASARRAEKKEEEKYKERQTSIQRGLLITQIILMVFGILGTAISAYQARTAQLAAESAKQAADTAADSLEISQGQFDRNIDKVIVQTSAQIQAAQAATSAANTARNALEIENRPWLAVSAKVTKFNWSERPPQILALNFKYEITVENLGNLPASKVHVIYDQTPVPKLLTQDAWKTLMKEQEAYCATQMTTGGGVTVFPHQPHTFAEVGFLVEHTLRDWSGNQGQDILSRGLYIRGCVAYQSPTNGMRQTGFFYTLRRRVDTDIFPDIPDIRTPLDRIYLVDSNGAAKSD